MPRAGWLAAGALAVALASPWLLPGVGALAALVVGVIVAAAAMATRRHRLAALGLGAAALAVRITAGGLLEPPERNAALPASDVAWVGRVESVTAPSRG